MSLVRVTISHNPVSMARRIAQDVPQIDQNFPQWARRTNPIVRRQLGMYWRVFPPQLGPITKWFCLQAVIMLLTIPYPLLMVVVLTFLLMSLFMLPVAFYIYIVTLGKIINQATTSMAEELKNDTLALLRTTPLSTADIVLSNIAAAVWRRADELDQVVWLKLMLSLPVIAMFYLTRWPTEDGLYVAQIMTVVTFAASLIRLPLEMFMVAALGVAMGAATGIRSSALIATATCTFFYFLLINLMRLLELSPGAQLIVDATLPLILPVIISWLAIRLAFYLINRD
jgi:hypothetical protein